MGLTPGLLPGPHHPRCRRRVVRERWLGPCRRWSVSSTGHPGRRRRREDRRARPARGRSAVRLPGHRPGPDGRWLAPRPSSPSTTSSPNRSQLADVVLAAAVRRRSTAPPRTSRGASAPSHRRSRLPVPPGPTGCWRPSCRRLPRHRSGAESVEQIWSEIERLAPSHAGITSSRLRGSSVSRWGGRRPSVRPPAIRPTPPRTLLSPGPSRCRGRRNRRVRPRRSARAGWTGPPRGARVRRATVAEHPGRRRLRAAPAWPPASCTTSALAPALADAGGAGSRHRRCACTRTTSIALVSPTAPRSRSPSPHGIGVASRRYPDAGVPGGPPPWCSTSPVRRSVPLIDAGVRRHRGAGGQA